VPQEIPDIATTASHTSKGVTGSQTAICSRGSTGRITPASTTKRAAVVISSPGTFAASACSELRARIRSTVAMVSPTGIQGGSDTDAGPIAAATKPHAGSISPRRSIGCPPPCTASQVRQ
jgi:hypothetical protein